MLFFFVRLSLFCPYRQCRPCFSAFYFVHSARIPFGHKKRRHPCRRYLFLLFQGSPIARSSIACRSQYVPLATRQRRRSFVGSRCRRITASRPPSACGQIRPRVRHIVYCPEWHSGISAVPPRLLGLNADVALRRVVILVFIYLEY